MSKLLMRTLRGEPTERVAMGLSPSEAGATMLVDSLFHYLSVIQALWQVADTTEVGKP